MQAGFFYDPVLRQVAHDFLPSLLASVETRIQAQAVSHAQLDDLVLRGLQEAVLQNAKARTAAVRSPPCSRLLATDRSGPVRRWAFPVGLCLAHLCCLCVRACAIPFPLPPSPRTRW